MQMLISDAFDNGKVTTSLTIADLELETKRNAGLFPTTFCVSQSAYFDFSRKPRPLQPSTAPKAYPDEDSHAPSAADKSNQEGNQADEQDKPVGDDLGEFAAKQGRNFSFGSHTCSGRATVSYFPKSLQ
jgi:hypothetical protein